MCRGARLQQHRVCKCHLVNQNDYNHNAHVQLLAPLTAALITTVGAAAGTTSSTGIACDLQQTSQAPPAASQAAAAAAVVGSPSSTSITTSTTTNSTSTSSIPPPPPPPSTNHRQRSFMKRSMASRTVSFIEAEVETLTSQCQFIVHNNSNRNNNNTSTIMELDRSQIVVGELLGEGGFSSVYEVRNIFHNRSDDDHDDDHDDDDFDDDAMEEEQQEPKCDYVIKHLRRDVVMPQSLPSHGHSNNRSRSKFYSAAADIVWEARCLAALDHPNIIKLRGVAKGDVQCFGDGTHDSYFLMLDRLDETLTHQLHRWRRRNAAATTTTTTSSGKVGHHYHQTPGQNQKQQLSSSSSSPCRRPPNDIDLMEEKLDLARQVASALQYMHARNIIYRDIKPSNIGLKRTKKSASSHDGFDPDHTTTTDAVLLDFGLCRELPFNGTTEQAKKDEFFLMSMVGTRRFIAPEVALGDGYNLQADVYSFTLMVYELMTLVTPFAMYSREMHECLVVHDNVRPQLSSSWSESVRSFFERGWARNPVDRPTISEVIDQLETLAREERSRRSKIEAVLLRAENDDVVVAEPQRKKAAFKRKNSATKRVWFNIEPGIFNINGLPSLLRKASSSFYESGGSCCTTTSTASLSRGTSDVSIADRSVEAE